MSTTEAETVKDNVDDTVKDEVADSKCDDVTSGEVADKSVSAELQALFTDRYTSENASYKQIENGFDAVIIIHPYHSRPKRVFDHSDRGRWRGDNRGQWRGGNNRGRGWQGKRRHDGDHSFRGGQRVHYPGLY